MSCVLKSIILTNIALTLVTSFIPNLSVKKFDTKLIARKRQDTLDICRLFNSQNNILQSKAIDASSKTSAPNQRNIRSKRDTNFMTLGNPAISAESIQRIENIVDKLYEDLEEKGQIVTHRTRTTVKGDANKTMRRFNFAPAALLGPLPTPGAQLSDPNIDDGFPLISWPKKWKHGIVPYFIDSKTYDAQLADTIMKAFDYFEKVTCIRLQRLRDKPTDTESLQNVEWLYITNPSGIRQCVHSNEKKANKGVQMVVLGYDCLSHGEIVHEVMHILGFSHEHTRPDRDQYVTILWNNIKPGYKKYFEMRTEDPLLDIPYDYSSVLHYPQRAFSKNGHITIMGQNGAKLGQREGLSETDVEKVGLIFGNECVERNRQYLLKTCPSAVKSNRQSLNVSQTDISNYFNGKLWPYGIINYKLKDVIEFSIEERENIKTVIDHIENETCIQFRDISNDEVVDEIEIRNETENKNDNNDKRNTTEIENDIAIVRAGHETNSKSNTKRINISQTKARAPRNDVKKSLRHAESIIVFTRSSGSGCSCPNSGKPHGKKILKINGDCFNSVNDLLHLFVHLLGLDHQHNMHDRDEYLKILWNNLTPEVNKEMKNKLPPAASVGFDYDYQSVMHYPWLQIKNGVTNLMFPIWNDGWAMGDWQGLSAIDVQKINVLYYGECSKRQIQTEDQTK